MLPPMLAPCSPPNIAIQPAATQPTKGIDDTAGAAAAPTLVPTSLPVPSAIPTALIQARSFCDSSGLFLTNVSRSEIHYLALDTGAPWLI